VRRGSNNLKYTINRISGKPRYRVKYVVEIFFLIFSRQIILSTLPKKSLAPILFTDDIEQHIIVKTIKTIDFTQNLKINIKIEYTS